MNGIENKVVPIELIRSHKRNYRGHPDEQLRFLRSSHERFGQYRSVVLWSRPDGTYITVAGHGIIQAMQQRGVTTLRADVLPSETPQETINAILVADNHIALSANDDEALLAQLLREQANAGYDLASLGTDDEALRQMLASLNEDMRESMRVSQEQRNERMINGSDEDIGVSPEEAYERYQNTDIRQVMLIYDQSEYVRIMKIFAEARKREKLETNTDVVTLLLNQYAQDHDLEEVYA